MNQKWENRIQRLNSKRWVRKLQIYLRRLVIPGFEGIPFITVMKFFIESLVKGIVFQRAAAMAYQIFVSAIPMLMALFAAISFLDESVRIQLMDFISTIVPGYTWPAVERIIVEVVMKRNGVLLYTSSIMGIVLATMALNAIITTLNITYFEIQSRNIFKQLQVSFGLLIAFFFLLISAIGIFIGTSFLIHHFNVNILGSTFLYTWTIKIAKWLLLLFLIYIFVSLLYYFAPANKKYFRLFSAGSSFATIMLCILLYALNIYFYYFPTYNIIYGSIGALFAVLLWIYLSSMIILIGFDLNVSIHIAKESQKKPEEIILESMMD